MASPVAHSFAGYWTFLALGKRLQTKAPHYRLRNLSRLLFLIAVANLADVDFVLGYIWRGNANALHHGFTHSFTVAAMVSVVLSFVWQMAPDRIRTALLYFVAYSSHLIIDLVSGTRLGWNNTGSDIPLFWPYPKEFTSPLILIVGVYHRDMATLLSYRNVRSSLQELLVFGIITVTLLLWRTWYPASKEKSNPSR